MNERPSTGTVAPILLTDKQAAALYGVGLTTFHELRNEPWMPRPRMLGPRLPRWSRSELEAAVVNMPLQIERSEPAQLARRRIDRLKGGAA